MSKAPKDSSDRDDGDNYQVGYGHPPLSTRFKKGQSGNPKGRPKVAMNANTLLKKQMSKTVAVRENGDIRKMSSLEGLMAKAFNEALHGRMKPLADLIRLLLSANLISPDQLAERFPNRRQVTIRIIKPNPRPGDPNYVSESNTSEFPLDSGPQRNDDKKNS